MGIGDDPAGAAGDLGPADDLARQLRYARALHGMAEAIAGSDEPRGMLDVLVRAIGETLGLDRCLILDLDSRRGLAAGMCEWLNPGNPAAFSVLRDYPLASFPRSWEHLWGRREHLVSHDDAPAASLADEGMAAFIHGELAVRSLVWHPFGYRDDACYMLVLNQVSHRRAWRDDELVFVADAATHAGLALQKRRILDERLVAEEQLRQSQKMEAIGRLAGGIAHDFNNLLTAIIGYADLLHDKMRGDDPLRRHVDGILQVANRAAATTHQLLSFSRRQVLRPKVLDLNTLVAQLEGLLRRLIGENIELDVQFAAEPLRVRVDAGQLELALVNLAVNARDAMPSGGRLRLRTAACTLRDERAVAARLPPGRYASVEVVDDGQGMDAETLRHLFEPFFTTKEVGKGTGLGLSSVYGIVAAAGGGIEVESAPGRGSRFVVLLPRDAGPDGTPSAGHPVLQAGGGSETLLMAEDDAVLRDLLGGALRDRGYRVIEAGDGQEALRLAQAEPGIDLLLSDVVMPRMNGPALARALRALRPSTRVLFMSGYTADAFTREPELATATVLAKPFTIDDLVRAVRTELDARTGS